eukprot:TRINITY_DN2430_c0_g1_i1.p1 TRINITY_DN2430_c0_g1~~TRINITY_DN2430_c0_g1_i1.p1  ORF type:complete len:644 (+),score=176.67 TRINITY_DN2430_c0_g1_i1:69-1934(+)
MPGEAEDALTVGDRVECNTNAGWLEATVVASDEGGAGVRVKLDAGPEAVVPSLDPGIVRRLPPLSAYPGLEAAAESAPAELREWCGRFDNTLVREMCRDPTEDVPQQFPRQVEDYWCSVKTRPSRGPLALVAASTSCARELGLAEACLQSDAFAELVAGNRTLPGCGCWATNYGVHHQGQFSEQRGDGRAMAIGEIVCPDGVRREVQLKGSGATPFCRRADGRAVLRSSVRELLASEAMHHLGVPTARTLAVVATGESVMRQWFNTKFSAADDSHRHPMQTVKTEQCAVTCRVSQSYVRFGSLELFWVRGDLPRLRALAEYSLQREFPDLREVQPEAERFTAMFERVCDGSARLIAEWERVGHVHGNMNSDNMMVGARTFDYGPFGMMDAYDPYLSPWRDGPEYCAHRQSSAMKKNVQTLGRAFTDLVEASRGTPAQLTRILHAAGVGYDEAYGRYAREMHRRKLGLKVAGEDIWEKLLLLMLKAQTDYHVLFRLLRDITGRFPPDADPLDAIQAAFYQQTLSERASEEWRVWLRGYAERVAEEGHAGRGEEMRLANPRYVLRNWMMTLAYEKAEDGDYSVVRELLQLLADPYTDQGPSAERWQGRAPEWSRGTPGVEQMS